MKRFRKGGIYRREILQPYFPGYKLFKYFGLMDINRFICKQDVTVNLQYDTAPISWESKKIKS